MDIQWLLVGLVKIIFINIVLSGDNAVVIALASRNLPLEQQKKAIFFGSFGAVVLRIMLTVAAVWLLQIPYVQVAGGLLLIYIAVKLLKNDGNEEEPIRTGKHLGEAIKTIIIADIVMSLDNVLAIAGAASGNYALIGLGLAVSIPLIIWGSRLLMRLMNRFPVIVWLGAGLLGYTAGEMIVGDKAIGQALESMHPALHFALPALFAVFVIVAGRFAKRRQKKQAIQEDLESSAV